MLNIDFLSNPSAVWHSTNEASWTVHSFVYLYNHDYWNGQCPEENTKLSFALIQDRNFWLHKQKGALHQNAADQRSDLICGSSFSSVKW